MAHNAEHATHTEDIPSMNMELTTEQRELVTLREQNAQLRAQTHPQHHEHATQAENVNGNSSRLQNLKRRRARERGNITRFVTEANNFDDNTTTDEFQYCAERLRETLNKVTALENQIHDLIPNEEYEADILRCDEYIDAAKRTIFKLSSRMNRQPVPHVITNDNTNVQTVLPPTIKLPTIKLEPFSGDIESWSRFWEQFEQSIDKNPALSTTHKHIFLRGYLEDEPKHLVEGLAVVAETYEETKRILQRRYGDKNRIIQAHLDYLEGLKPIHFVSPETLNTAFIDCNKRIQALRSLGEDVNSYGRILVPKILRAFPDDMCKKWIIYAKRERLSEDDIIKLMDFLSDEVEAALLTQKIRGISYNSSSTTPSAAILNVKTTSGKTGRNNVKVRESFCVFCEAKGHWAQDCKVTTSVRDRIEVLKAKNRCFLCLNRGHTTKICPKKQRASCSACKKCHHRSICKELERPTPQIKLGESTLVGSISVTPRGYTYLQTACVWICGPSGKTKLTRCVLDCGSQSSFISSSLIDSLHLEVIDNKPLVVNAFEMNSVTSGPRRLVRAKLRSIHSDFELSFTAFESAHIFTRLPTVPKEIQTYSLQSNLKLADPTDWDEDLPIEILIGAEHYWRIMNDAAPLRISSTTVLLPSQFGWILSGNRASIAINCTTVNFIGTQQDELTFDHVIRSFWDLEAIGIKPEHDRATSTKDALILQNFHDSFTLEDNRRVVRLPRKSGYQLPNNYENAHRRFETLQKRLKQDIPLKLIYEKEMLNYISRGHVEEVTSQDVTETFYLPHHVVHKSKQGNIKWRIVFDASAHEKHAPALNDTLEMGPNLLPEVLGILLRFRLHPFVITSDITQAFLQLVLHAEDRDLTRFFWYKTTTNDSGHQFTTAEVTIYRFKRLPFGLTCSPFLLSATIRELAMNYKNVFPLAAALVDKNTYMDDFVAGVNYENDIVRLYYELIILMKQINLPMAKWSTNSKDLTQIWRTEQREVQSNTRVLGVPWNTDTDSFTLEQPEINDESKRVATTKRQLLKTTSRFYDPLGLLTPISVVAKILFQETWTRGLQWNELLPTDLARDWSTWTSTLTELANITIPRFIGSSGDYTSQIHVFCDASEKAYGAALYITVLKEDGKHTNLMCSKCRLAPVKRVSLPRLELLATLIGARLLTYFCKATNLSTMHATMWTDSTVALGWIRKNPNHWKTFVCNRATEIHTITSPSQWNHCPSQHNPADMLTRGCTPSKLKASNLWWHGPHWLSKDPVHWPCTNGTPTDSQILPEARTTGPHILIVELPQPVIDVTRFSSYSKLLRVAARVLRVKDILHHKSKFTGELTAEELTSARKYLIRASQLQSFPTEHNALNNSAPLPDGSKIRALNPFLDEGIIRVGGRLHFSALTREEKHPIILDGDHHFTQLLVQHMHIHLHHLGVRIVLSQLRTEFWILRARQTIKKIIHRCLPCKMANRSTAQEIEAPLPADRVTPGRPFDVTGIDFAGPLYSKTYHCTKKCYIVLFTCATTRAIHLELASDMTTDKFLLALQRFVARRGIPHTIYSDNAQTFHAANKELTDLWPVISAAKVHHYLAHHTIIWKFIAPRAAWWGGWWERMVGTIKRCLRKVLGQSSLDDEALQTVLANIEAALNSRPLTQQEDSALTPAHFLVGDRLTTLPSGTPPRRPTNLAKMYKLRQKLVEDFWKRWSQEYLTQLRSYHEVRRPKGSTRLREGDLVLLQEDIRQRQCWRRARVAELRRGRDGLIRTVILDLPDGHKVTRPIQLVVPLEVDQGGEDVE